MIRSGSIDRFRMTFAGLASRSAFQVLQDAAVARGLVDTTGFAQRVQLLLQQAQRFDLMMNARDLLVDEMVDVVARIRFDDQSAQLQPLARSRRAERRPQTRDSIQGAGANQSEVARRGRRPHDRAGQQTRARQNLLPGPVRQVRRMTLFAGRINRSRVRDRRRPGHD